MNSNFEGLGDGELHLGSTDFGITRALLPMLCRQVSNEYPVDFPLMK